MKKIKADISLGATKREREDVVKKIRRIKRLLNHFGISAYAFDPGVRGIVLGDGVKMIDFDGNTWEFVEPLLRELLKYRRKYEVSGKRS